MRAFGEICGYLFALFMLGAGAGPFAMGLSFDVTGSYQFMLASFAIALLLASALMMGLGSYVIRRNFGTLEMKGVVGQRLRLPYRRRTVLEGIVADELNVGVREGIRNYLIPAA